MLSKTRKSSPIRIATGLVGVSAVTLAALGLTASGTQAAERIKAKVEKSIGLQEVPPPPAAPAPNAAPEPAPAPEAAAAPEAPEAPRHVEKHVYRTADGKQIKKVVIVHDNGETNEIVMPDVAAIEASVPQVRDGNCGGGGSATIEHREQGGKKFMIICQDRIAKITIHAQQLAMQSKRMGLNGALAGLNAARRSLEHDSELGSLEREKALKGIDQAMNELQKQMDKDEDNGNDD